MIWMLNEIKNYTMIWIKRGEISPGTVVFMYSDGLAAVAGALFGYNRIPCVS